MVYRNSKFTVGSKVMTGTKSVLKIALKFLQSLHGNLVHMQEHQIPSKYSARFRYENLHGPVLDIRNKDLEFDPNN